MIPLATIEYKTILLVVFDKIVKATSEIPGRHRAAKLVEGDQGIVWISANVDQFACSAHSWREEV